MFPLNMQTAPEDTKVCFCNDVTLAEIKDAIRYGARTLDDIRETTSACTGNRCEELNPKGVCCEADIENILALSCKGSGPTRGGCKCCEKA